MGPGGGRGSGKTRMGSRRSAQRGRGASRGGASSGGGSCRGRGGGGRGGGRGGGVSAPSASSLSLTATCHPPAVTERPPEATDTSKPVTTCGQTEYRSDVLPKTTISFVICIEFICRMTSFWS